MGDQRECFEEEEFRIPIGIHQGMTYKSVWAGARYEKESVVIANYIWEFLQFILGKFPYEENKVCGSDTSHKILEGKLYNSFDYIYSNSDDCRIGVFNKYIVFEGSDETIYHLNRLIDPWLTGDFKLTRLKPLYKDAYDASILEFSKRCKYFIQIQGHPSWFDWSIKNQDHWCLKPEFLKMLSQFKSRYLKSFHIERIRDDIIAYTPIFAEFQYTLSDETVKLNTEKYNAYLERCEAELKAEGEYWALVYRQQQFWDDLGLNDPTYCGACQSSPCMCSDPEQTSTIHDY